MWMIPSETFSWTDCIGALLLSPTFSGLLLMSFFLPCLISLSYVVASVFVFDDFDGDDELVLFSGDLSYMRSFWSIYWSDWFVFLFFTPWFMVLRSWSSYVWSLYCCYVWSFVYFCSILIYVSCSNDVCLKISHWEIARMILV